jgi:ABC-2 type transport system ATP-binding protein
MTQTQDAQSIIVEELVKLYGQARALNKISFSVAPGEIVGFLGPNGAGKTTTMKILTCFMSATAGSARVAGFDVSKDSEQVRRRLGYLPENVPLYDEMLVWDYLKFIAEIRGVAAKEHKARIDEVVELTGLGLMIHKSIGELSKGYRQRVGLAQAIIHRPEVVILDEPTTGLDPNQIVEIRDVIKTIGKEKTVMFSTHIMQEVSAVCDRVIIINRGQIVADGTLDALAQDMRAQRPGLELSLATGERSAQELKAQLEALKEVKRVEQDPDSVRHWRLIARHDEAKLKQQLYELASQRKLDIERVGPYQPSLEAIFRALTEGQTEERELATQASANATTPQEDE